MIYDCFSFFNELDVLEIRLNILNEVVDRFVLVEATRTYRGTPKPLFFSESRDRFAPFLDKIIHIVVDDFSPVERYIASPTSDPKKWSWAYEDYQRHSFIRGLADLQDDDVLVVSDLDEIPTANAVRKAAKLSRDGKVRLLQLSHRSYFLNYCNFSMPHWEWGPMVLSGRAFRDAKTYEKPQRINGSVKEVLTTFPSPQLLRLMQPDEVVQDAGWHFSFMGGTDMILKKLASFAHTEYSTGKFKDSSHIAHVIANGGDLFGLGDRYYAVSTEKCLPPYILSHQEKYAQLIYPTSSAYLRKTRMRKISATVFYVLRTITPRQVKHAIYQLIHTCCPRR